MSVFFKIVAIIFNGLVILICFAIFKVANIFIPSKIIEYLKDSYMHSLAALTLFLCIANIILLVIPSKLVFKPIDNKRPANLLDGNLLPRQVKFASVKMQRTNLITFLGIASIIWGTTIILTGLYIFFKDTYVYPISLGTIAIGSFIIYDAMLYFIPLRDAN